MKSWHLSIQSSLTSSPACGISKAEKFSNLANCFFSDPYRELNMYSYSDPSPSADCKRGKMHVCKQWLILVLLLIGWKTASWSANENSRYYIHLRTTLYEPSVQRNQKTQSCQKLQPESSATNINTARLKIEYHIWSDCHWYIIMHTDKL